MADVGGIQLLPETRKKISVSVPGQNRPMLFALAVLVLLIAAYLVLSVSVGGTMSSIEAVDIDLANVEKSRDKALENKLINLDKQLDIVNPLLSGHLVWSDALTRIQQLISPQVQFKSFSAGIDTKKFTFQAVAADFTTVAKQIAAFYSDDAITDVLLNKVIAVPDGVEVSMELVFDSNKFLLRLSQPQNK